MIVYRDESSAVRLVIAASKHQRDCFLTCRRVASRAGLSGLYPRCEVITMKNQLRSCYTCIIDHRLTMWLLKKYSTPDCVFEKIPKQAWLSFNYSGWKSCGEVMAKGCARFKEFLQKALRGLGEVGVDGLNWKTCRILEKIAGWTVLNLDAEENLVVAEHECRGFSMSDASLLGLLKLTYGFSWEQINK